MIGRKDLLLLWDWITPTGRRGYSRTSCCTPSMSEHWRRSTYSVEEGYVRSRYIGSKSLANEIQPLSEDHSCSSLYSRQAYCIIFCEPLRPLFRRSDRICRQMRNDVHFLYRTLNVLPTNRRGTKISSLCTVRSESTAW